MVARVGRRVPRKKKPKVVSRAESEVLQTMISMMEKSLIPFM